MSGLLSTGGIDSGVETENDCSNDVAEQHQSKTPENYEFIYRKNSLDTPPPPAPPTSPEISATPVDFLQATSSVFGMDAGAEQNNPRFPHQPRSHEIIINIDCGEAEDVNDGKMNMDDTEVSDFCHGNPSFRPYPLPETPEEDEDNGNNLFFRPYSFPASSEISKSHGIDDLRNGAYGVTPMTSAASRNNCRSLVKFESVSNLPKLESSIEPPAGLNSFISLREMAEAKTRSCGGYSLYGSPVLESYSLALTPYEQRDVRSKQRAFYTGSCLRNKYLSGTRQKKDNYASLLKQHNERRLRDATSLGNVTMLRKLLDLGVDPNCADGIDRTPLHLAACKGHSEIVKLLLQAGANPNLKDIVGNTPLHLAACTSQFEVVTCLLRGGTDVSTLDNYGRNPLHLAQSKLKLLANSKSESSDTLKVKLEIQQIIEMMLEYLQKKGQDEEAELLTVLASRLTLSTPQQVNEDVTSLLANLSSLSLGNQRQQRSPSDGLKEAGQNTSNSSSPFNFSKKLPPVPSTELASLQSQLVATSRLTCLSPSSENSPGPSTSRNPWRSH